MFIQDTFFFVLNSLIHSFTISANEVDATDSIRSHRGQPAVAAMEGHVTGNQLTPPAGSPFSCSVATTGSDLMNFLPIRTVQN